MSGWGLEEALIWLIELVCHVRVIVKAIIAPHGFRTSKLLLVRSASASLLELCPIPGFLPFSRLLLRECVEVVAREVVVTVVWRGLGICRYRWVE